MSTNYESLPIYSESLPNINQVWGREQPRPKPTISQNRFRKCASRTLNIIIKIITTSQINTRTNHTNSKKRKCDHQPSLWCQQHESHSTAKWAPPTPTSTNQKPNKKSIQNQIFRQKKNLTKTQLAFK